MLSPRWLSHVHVQRKKDRILPTVNQLPLIEALELKEISYSTNSQSVAANRGAAVDLFPYAPPPRHQSKSLHLAGRQSFASA
jgi:hypothetical protein